MAVATDRLAFMAEWYDPLAAIVRSYQLFYYPNEASIEMFDVKLRRPFLKKTKMPDIRLSDLYIGNSINVLSRQIKLVSFGDDYTRKKLSAKTEKCLLILTASLLGKLGTHLDELSSSGLLVVNLKMVQLSPQLTVNFSQCSQKTRISKPLTAALSSGPAVAVELVGSDAIEVCQQLFRGVSELVFVSGSSEAAEDHLTFFFGETHAHVPNTATVQPNATCAVVLPHAVNAGMTGAILSAINSAGFQVTALEMFRLDRASAEEFLEIYKGVVAEYPAMVAQLTSGSCVALEITCADGDAAYKRFRDFAGPPDPAIAKHLSPRSLRAQFGSEKVTNAVHCTDLPEDCVLELQYFFQLLDK